MGDWAFARCSNLRAISIPDSVTHIPSWCFIKCSSLKEVKLSTRLSTIGCGAFEECPSLASLDLPQSVTDIGSSAFKGCSSLTTIAFPQSITHIGSSAFHNCPNLAYVGMPPQLSAHICRYAEEYFDAKLAEPLKQSEWRRLGLCLYCGGSFKGLIFKKCEICGREYLYTLLKRIIRI